MNFPCRDILQETARLEVPCPSQLVISHGSALVVRGIRPEHEGSDIDIVTSRENIDYLCEVLGFLVTPRVVGIGDDGVKHSIVVCHDTEHRFDVHEWDFSVLQERQTGNGRMSLEQLISESDQDELTDIWVAKPELVLRTKVGTNRPKDIQDVRRIQQYLKLGH